MIRIVFYADPGVLAPVVRETIVVVIPRGARDLQFFQDI
jgi:hypothetical protein